MEEKRHFGRIPFGMAVELGIDGEGITGALMDISLKGALVETDRHDLLSSGSDCTLTLPLSEDVTLAFRAEAVHFHEKSVGFKFTGLDEETFSHLRRLLELNTGDPEKVERELSFLAKFI